MQASCSGAVDTHVTNSTVILCAFIWLQLSVVLFACLFFFCFLGFGGLLYWVFACFLKKNLKLIGVARSGKSWRREEND